MNRDLAVLSALPVHSIEAYIQAVNSIPILDADEEKSLAIALHEQDDLHAAKTLVLSHLRFVVHIARGYNGYGLPMLDLVQEGSVGLMKAVKRFDPYAGVRLISFAVHWIRAEIHEFILKNWRIVKVATTKAQRKLFFNLRRNKKRLGWLNQQEIEAIAKDLQVKPEMVREMESRLSGQDVAFDGTPDQNDDANEHEYVPAHYLKDKAGEPADMIEKADWDGFQYDKLQQALETLDQRSRHIIEQRWLNETKATLQTLAAHYNVSAERIRQLEKQALQQLKSAM